VLKLYSERGFQGWFVKASDVIASRSSASNTSPEMPSPPTREQNLAE
jgi:hypothetical protein